MIPNKYIITFEGYEARYLIIITYYYFAILYLTISPETLQ